jgi:hypothetical protein
MNKLLSKITDIFGYFGKILNTLDFMGLLFIIILSIGATVYFLVNNFF